jgi:hypothetical protein
MAKPLYIVIILIIRLGFKNKTEINLKYLSILIKTSFI